MGKYFAIGGALGLVLLAAVLLGGCRKNDDFEKTSEDSVKLEESTESAERVESVGKTDSMESAENMESTGKMESAENMESAETMGNTESLQMIGSATTAFELIFDKKDLCQVTESGIAVTYDDWASTDYVDIRGYYALSYVLAAHKNVYAVSFYDADRNFISGVGEGEGRDTFTIATVQGSAVIPEGAAYARFITYSGSRDPMEDASVVGYPTRECYEEWMNSRTLSGMKVACLGDSLTEGDYGLQVGVANVFYRGYPFFFAQMTGAVTVNYGYCGATSSYYLSEYNAGRVDVTDANVVILMLGTNLGLEGDLGEAYRQLVGEVRKDMKEDAVLILVTPPHATEDETKPNYGYHENVVSAVEFVREFAAAEGLPLIDAYADSPIQPENEDVYQTNDGLHMCEAGYEAFARFMAEEVERILEDF